MAAEDRSVPASGQARFERLRQRSGFVLAPIAFAAGWWVSAGLNPPAHRLAAVLAAVVVLWLTEAIPMAVTAFLGVAAAVVLQVAPAKVSFAPFADPLIFLFIGTFMLARAIFFHGLDRRFAFAILGLRGVGSHPGRVLAAYAAATCTLSMWISNTATTAMMFPIGLSLLRFMDSPRQGGPLPAAYASVLLLSTAFAASIGGLATPVGTPPNLIGLGFIRRQVGVDLPFFSWMAIGLPVAIALLVATVCDLWRKGVPRGTTSASVHELVATERQALGPWTRGQVNTMIAFAVTVSLWILPGLAALTLGQEAPIYQRLVSLLPEGVVALLGAGLLFLLPIDWGRNQFTLSWEEAVKIEWWIVFLYGGGMALGTLAFETGLAAAMGEGLTRLLGVKSGIALLALSTTFAVVLSETTSNTASVNMAVPVVIALAESAGIDPLLPAVGATMGASLGFMLPVSTPCNAIVYASGRIPLPTMIRHGLVLDLVGTAAIVALVALLGPVVIGRGAP